MYDCQSVFSSTLPDHARIRLSPIVSSLPLSLCSIVCLRHPLAVAASVHKRIERVATRTNAYVSGEWRQDPRRHVTGAPLLCRREFAPDEAALRQQTATGVSRQAPVVLSTLRYILRGRRARGQSTLDDRHSRSSIVYSHDSLATYGDIVVELARRRVSRFSRRSRVLMRQATQRENFCPPVRFSSGARHLNLAR